MVTTINSLPQEILFLILEFASSHRSEVVSSIFDQPFHIQNYALYKLYFESNKLLASTALVSKEWTYPSQSLLLSSIALRGGDRTLNRLLCAPVSQLPAHQLILHMNEAWQTVGIKVRKLLPCLIRMKSLFLGYNGLERVGDLDISAFFAPSLSELQHLTLRNLVLCDQSNYALIILPFQLKRLDIDDTVIPDAALKAFITPTLDTLTVIQLRSRSGDQFSNSLRIAAPYIHSLCLKLYNPQYHIHYITIIPLCTFITEFHFFVFEFYQPLFEIISAFPINQLLHLKLSFYSDRGLPDLIMLLHQPSLQNLRFFSLVCYKLRNAPPEDLIIPLQVSEECRRRGISYKYEIINNY